MLTLPLNSLQNDIDLDTPTIGFVIWNKTKKQEWKEACSNFRHSSYKNY